MTPLRDMDKVAVILRVPSRPKLLKVFFHAKASSLSGPCLFKQCVDGVRPNFRYLRSAAIDGLVEKARRFLCHAGNTVVSEHAVGMQSSVLVIGESDSWRYVLDGVCSKWMGCRRQTIH